MPSRTEVVVSEQVRAFAATLHPEHRRDIKAALLKLSSGEGDIRPLEEDLKGLYRLRIECLFAEQRSLVYDLLRSRPDLWA
jgi:mRNA-degrading endonuclease RelE of RelBE toxin-antitoxin system